MKCVNCFREIDDGIKFCPKCGFIQPEDREAYEREHPELADALPEEELMSKVELITSAAATAMSREDFVQLVATDPHRESIIKIVDDGVVKYGFNETASPQWYAKCGELINDKQGFYPYFVMLLSQQYEKARDLLFNQASYGMDAVSESEKDYESPVVPTTPSLSTGGYKLEHDRLVAHIQAANPHLQKDNAADVAKKSNLMRCPICHNQISHDVDECPFCHQRLDKNSSPQDNTTDTDSNTNRKNHIGEVLFFSVCLVLILLIIGVNFCDNNRYESSSVDLSDSVSFSEAHSYLYDNPAENTKSADDAAAIDDDASLPKDDYEQESYEVVPDLDEVLEESVSYEEIQEIFE